MKPKPWTRSKTVWVLIGIVIPNLVTVIERYFNIQLAEVNQLLLSVWSVVMAILAARYRWVASGPLVKK